MALKWRPTVAAVDFDRLSRRGHRGGEIRPHRSLDSLRLPPQRLLGGAALALTLTLLLLWARPWIAAAWSGELGWWLQALEIPARFEFAVASTTAADAQCNFATEYQCFYRTTTAGCSAALPDPCPPAAPPTNHCFEP